MKILIVYDSLYGNTEKIAKAIAEVFSQHEARIKKAKDSSSEDLQGIDLLIVGSPTHGGRASESTKQFFDYISNNSLKSMRAAAFDTGIPISDKKGFLKFILRFFGYAAKHIAKILEKKGARVIASETFFVLEKEGPLMDGEIERAKKWSKQLLPIN